MREQEAHSRRVELGMTRAVEAVSREANAERTSDEPVGEGVLREIRQQPTGDYEARAVDPFSACVPGERGGAEQPADLNGVALCDGEGEPRRDAFVGRYTSSFMPGPVVCARGRASPTSAIPSSDQK